MASNGQQDWYGQDWHPPGPFPPRGREQYVYTGQLNHNAVRVNPPGYLTMANPPLHPGHVHQTNGYQTIRPSMRAPEAQPVFVPRLPPGAPILIALRPLVNHNNGINFYEQQYEVCHLPNRQQQFLVGPAVPSQQPHHTETVYTTYVHSPSRGPEVITQRTVTTTSIQPVPVDVRFLPHGPQFPGLPQGSVGARGMYPCFPLDNRPMVQGNPSWGGYQTNHNIAHIERGSLDEFGDNDRRIEEVGSDDEGGDEDIYDIYYEEEPNKTHTVRTPFTPFGSRFAYGISILGRRVSVHKGMWQGRNTVMLDCCGDYQL